MLVLLPGLLGLPRLLVALLFDAGGAGQAGGVVRIGRSRLGHLENRAADAGVGTAAAEVPREAVMDLGQRRVGVLVEQGLGGHDEARGTEAALLCVVLDEGGLERMELVDRAETLDGLDPGVLGLDRQDAAGVDRPAVQEDGAGAARAAVADPLGAGEL